MGSDQGRAWPIASTSPRPPSASLTSAQAGPTPAWRRHRVACRRSAPCRPGQAVRRRTPAPRPQRRLPRHLPGRGQPTADPRGSVRRRTIGAATKCRARSRSAVNCASWTPTRRSSSAPSASTSRRWPTIATPQMPPKPGRSRRSRSSRMATSTSSPTGCTALASRPTSGASQSLLPLPLAGDVMHCCMRSAPMLTMDCAAATPTSDGRSRPCWRIRITGSGSPMRRFAKCSLRTRTAPRAG